MTGYFSGLSSPSASTGPPRRRPGRGRRRPGRPGSRRSRRRGSEARAPGSGGATVDPLGVEVARRARRDGRSGHAHRAQAVGVPLRLKVARDRPDAAPPSERARGRLEDRGLAGPRGAHQVDDEDPALDEVLAVVRRRPVVDGQDPVVDLHGDVSDRRSRRSRTSRHLHLDLLQENLVAGDELRRRVAGPAAQDGAGRDGDRALRAGPGRLRAPDLEPRPRPGIPSRHRVKAEAKSSGSTPDIAPMRTARRLIAMAFRARASCSTRSTMARTNEYSCIVLL